MSRPELRAHTGPEDPRERSLFRAGRYAELADESGGGLLAARACGLVDRLDQAAAMLDQVAAWRPDLAVDVAIERADLGLRRYDPPDAILAALDSLPPTTAGQAHGRRLVVRATALNRLHRVAEAAAAAIAAVEEFTRLQAVDERARALEALGTVLAWSGDLEQSSLRFSLALADWATVGNVVETAAVIAGLGRLNLEAHRHAHALDFLTRARDLAPFPDASRGGIRLRHSIAQALAGLDRNAEARAMLLAGADDARRGAFPYLEFVCLRDAAVAAARGDEPAAAASLLARAAAVMDGYDATAYDRVSLQLARGAVAAAVDSPDAIPLLEAAAGAVAGRQLGGPEIDNLRLLARALARRGHIRAAERRLTAAHRLAAGKGLSWHRREIRMDLARLKSADGSLDESDRPIHHAGPSAASVGIPEHGYLVRERLGGGSFGEVYRGYDLDNAREVAIKRLTFTGLYDVDTAARILASVDRELDAARRVEHPGVARVHGIVRRGGGEVHVVQEFIEGPSLRSRMTAEPRPDPLAVARLASRLAQALAAVHRGGVIHRDLKPENVILRRGGDPVIIDFGIAHLDAAGRAPAPGLGTPAYMPPEQAAGRRPDARCDVYALGVIILEWLDGLPADDPSAAPVRLVAKRMAHPRRWRRPASMDEVVAALRAVVEDA